MHPYPHTYVASASAESAGFVAIASPRLPSLETAPPAQFGGPGDLWSPETLLCASLADCFILTFRAVTRAARFKWLSLECRVEGVLERVGQVSQFGARIMKANVGSIDRLDRVRTWTTCSEI